MARSLAALVNFLLHHHLAARDLGSPEAAVGAMLPDLWRMADRRVRARRRPTAQGGGQGLTDVLAGIEHHLAADRWFHAAPVFLDGERRASERLREARITAPRIQLFAHVLWELCLDGELVRRVGVDTLVAALREGFDRVGGGAAEEAVDLHHFRDKPRTTEERAAFDARMGRLFEALAAGPWIEGYQRGAGIASRIEGVRVSLGLGPLDQESHARLRGVADALLEQARPAVDGILYGVWKISRS